MVRVVTPKYDRLRELREQRYAETRPQQAQAKPSKKKIGRKGRKK